MGGVLESALLVHPLYCVIRDLIDFILIWTGFEEVAFTLCFNCYSYFFSSDLAVLNSFFPKIIVACLSETIPSLM